MQHPFTRELNKWYKKYGRELPWRNTKDPYLIWISEIILQQTRVNQGYDYYLRFIKRFPNVKALAKANEDEVMKYWQGLGYYSRARNLHKAAQSIQAEFPHTYEEVIGLKGVGEYTAAAICSLAYNLPHAVVDGNVYRVLARYFGIDTPIDTSKGKKEFKELAGKMLDKSQPGDYNQAIMDFGALQCTPGVPDCQVCPLSDTCYAYRNNTVSQLPVKQHKTKTVDRFFNYLFVKKGNHTFLNKRTGNDIWKNLYELPLIETDRPIGLADLIGLPEFNTFISDNEKPHVRLLYKDIKHTLSHRIIYASFYEVILPDNSSSFSCFKRIGIDEIDEYAVSRLVHLFFEKYL